MTESEKAQFIRESVLGDLNACQPSTLPPATLALAARRNYGVPVTESELQAHLSKLANDGLITEVRNPISAGVVRYRIADSGVAYLVSQGLA
jgi:DNA-binding transcriptional ArsR family regulator